MKFTLLNENSVGYMNAQTCLAEWGFSLFIQINGINILFDTGATDVYLKNAKHLGIDLDTTNFVVLSHHHWDHTGGLKFLNFKLKKKIIIHPLILKKLSPKDVSKLKNDFEIISSAKPLEFSKNIYYLGEIPRINSFEKGKYENDPMSDDSAIVIKTKDGTIVITGCSHSGICNICSYAKKITGQRLYAVIGGFHLFEEDKNIVEKTINYFKNDKPRYLFPMHCVDNFAMTQFYNNFHCKKYSSGDSFEL